MKILNSKKAMVLYYIVIPGFILGLALFFVTSLSMQSPITKYVGENQLAIIHASQEADKSLIFIEHAAKLSADQALFDLANKGGFNLESACGDYDGYQIWNEICYPDYKTNFNALLNQNINDYIDQINFEKSPLEITDRLSFELITPDINYEIYSDNDQIIGIADKDFQFNMYIGPTKIIIKQLLARSTSKTTVARSGIYKIKPSFNINPGFDIEEFDGLIDQAAGLLYSCQYKSELEECIKENIDPNWNFGSCEGDKTIKDNSAKFCVKTDNKLWIYNEDRNKFESKPLRYKFAIQFSSISPESDIFKQYTPSSGPGFQTNLPLEIVESP